MYLNSCLYLDHWELRFIMKLYCNLITHLFENAGFIFSSGPAEMCNLINCGHSVVRHTAWPKYADDDWTFVIISNNIRAETSDGEIAVWPCISRWGQDEIILYHESVFKEC